MERNEIEIQVKVDLEFRDFYKVLWWQSFKKFWLLYFLALILTMFWSFSLLAGLIKFNPVLIFAQMPLIAAIFLQFAIYSGAKRSIDSVKGTTEWLFSEDGFKLFTPVAKNESTWASLVKIEEKKEHFLLYPQKNIFMLIPKRFFRDESQVEDFKRLIKEKLGTEAKLNA